MKYTASLLLASAGLATALTQQCSKAKPVNEHNNYFCDPVEQIVYGRVQGEGTYKEITHVSPDGEPHREDRHYNGPLAAFGKVGVVSIHIRGPIDFTEFAFYSFAPSKRKKRGEVNPTARADQGYTKAGRARGHGHRFLHRAQRDKRVDIVTATIDGKVQTWENNYFGAAATPEPLPVPAAQVDAGTSTGAGSVGTTSRKPTGEKLGHSSNSTCSKNGFVRTAYYNAEKQIADNVVFLGNYGGQGSGVFNHIIGNSLSFINSTANGGARSSQILEDMLIPSNKEVIIYSGKKCAPGDCFSYDPNVAYEGFRGGTVVFIFRFRMPLDGTRCPEGVMPGNPGCANPDMPALWFLHELVAREGQYSSRLCWPECGEVDIFEVLMPGDTKCKSTLHLGKGGGSSDYFQRPVDHPVKVAVVLHKETAKIAIKVLSETDLSKASSGRNVSDHDEGFSDGDSDEDESEDDEDDPEDEGFAKGVKNGGVPSDGEQLPSWLDHETVLSWLQTGGESSSYFQLTEPLVNEI
ncbi:uncharacterized protein MAM_05320 [Metarhizium album ARSEF 1941]|uniref:glucan endo-1,3-beta-D-glucosidase n=1 Tax=Metarhizium album (strain ARSEF 1941) TaxID=1081103 RepID=A0A0B2WT43_METAS|nr:uncharacterized protein MAM_05320 [Metarhizium album ARSEF 1941]KHN96764.1 hypothetical protein MAM_05320 [Metarhizium album ARSEF 1941]